MLDAVAAGSPPCHAGPMMRGFLLFVWLFFGCTAALQAAEAVSLVHVSDGDGLRVSRADGAESRVRLYGIDAPEDGQEGGDMAVAGLRDLLAGRRLSLLSMTRDRFGRDVALVFADGENVNAAMIERGLAWVYPDFCKPDFCEEWKKLEAAAREARRGLWRAERPQPPWKWRIQQRIIRRATPRPPDDPADPGEYRGNVNSRVFHRDGCPYFNCRDCTRSFSTREEAIDADFRPCSRCRP